MVPFGRTRCSGYVGGCAASLPKQSTKKKMVEAFVEALPGSVDEDALSNSTGLNNVATGLETAAAAFANLPVHVANKWNLMVWTAKSTAEKVARAHVEHPLPPSPA